MVEAVDSQVRTTPSGADSSEPCANCSAQLVGDYCHNCGEERPGRRDLSLKHFCRQSVRELIDLEESKALRTLGALLFKPGHLTNEYFGGRRSRYLSPLKLFITVFALSFLLYTIYKPVSVYDFDVIIKMDTTGRAAQAFEKLAAKKQLETSVLIERMNERLQRYVTWTQHVPVALLSLFLIFIYWNSKRFYVEHLIFSLHLLSFSYLMGVLLWPVMIVVGVGNMWLTLVLYPILYAYFFISLRRVYRESTLATAIKSLILFGCYFVVVLVSFWAVLVLAMINTMRS